MNKGCKWCDKREETGRVWSRGWKCWETRSIALAQQVKMKGYRPWFYSFIVESRWKEKNVGSRLNKLNHYIHLCLFLDYFRDQTKNQLYTITIKTPACVFISITTQWSCVTTGYEIKHEDVSVFNFIFHINVVDTHVCLGVAMYVIEYHGSLRSRSEL